MTIHIIGKPPAPKGGATFGDVPIAGDERDMRALFINNAGVILQRCGKRTARCLGLEELYEYGLHHPVTLLDVTPRDPEPDPAVTTYGELEPWEFFVFPDTPTILRQRVVVAHTGQGPSVGGCHMYDEALALPCPRDSVCQWGNDEPVRRVAASVVVHEEPGTHVRPKRGHFAYVNGSPADRETLRAIVQQGAALLAQKPASPESGEPLNVDMGEGFLDPSEDAGWRPPAEPAEDRSKPAPGYDKPDHGGKGWYSRGPDRQQGGVSDG